MDNLIRVDFTQRKRSVIAVDKYVRISRGVLQFKRTIFIGRNTSQIRQIAKAWREMQGA